MSFAGISLFAIAVAAVASFIFGGVWYGVLSKRWLAALGKSETELITGGRHMPLLFGITIAAEFVMAWILAGIIGHLGPDQVTFRNGVIAGVFIWLGFVATTLTVNYGFQGARWPLAAIDVGHWLGVLLIQGAILGWMGVA